MPRRIPITGYTKARGRASVGMLRSFLRQVEPGPGSCGEGGAPVGSAFDRYFRLTTESITRVLFAGTGSFGVTTAVSFVGVPTGTLTATVR